MGMNEEISIIFYEIADLMELKKDIWRAKAYRAAAQTLESLKKDVQDIYLEEGEKGINKIPNIGEALAKKIIQYIETEKIDKLEELKRTIPPGLYEMMQIPGVGVKKAELFYNKLGIKTIKDLKKAAETHKLLKLPSFKERAEEKILEGIKLLGIEGRIQLSRAEKIADKILNELKKIKEIKKTEIAGSIRRKKPEIRDFDFVILTNNNEKVAEKMARMGFVKKIISKGKEKLTIITKEDRQADFRFFNKEEYGAGLLYFTGDKNYNIMMRKLAIKNGWKLNEYGLFENNRRIAGKTEQEIFDKLRIKYTEPEDRVG